MTALDVVDRLIARGDEQRIQAEIWRQEHAPQLADMADADADLDHQAAAAIIAASKLMWGMSRDLDGLV